MSNKTFYMTDLEKLEVGEAPMPKVGPDDVMIKVQSVGVCGSDLHYYHTGSIGNFIVKPPFILGHEAAGIIEEVGENVKNLKPGDRVTLEPGYTCGKCEYCMSGRYNLCPDVVFMATPPYDGAFCEYVAWPAHMAFKLPDNMSYMEGALVEPLSVGLHAANMADAKLGQTAVVLGSGCIGLCTLMSLKARGVTKIYIADVIQKRLDKAKSLGATEVINAAEKDTVEEIMRLTDGKGCDLVFETAGSRITTQQTPYLVKIGGKIVLVGMAPNPNLEYDFAPLSNKEVTIQTIFRYRNKYPMAIQAISSGKIPIKEIATDFFDLCDTPKAMAYSVSNKADIVKAVIEVKD